MHPNPACPEEDTPLLAVPKTLKGNTIYIYLVTFLSAIGGFLFGYDTGIISGAMIFIKDVFNLNEAWQESIVSSTLLTAWFFSIISGAATDRYGRKPVILGSSLIFVAGALLMAFAWNQAILLVGRMVVGAGVGLSSMTVPMFIAEVAPSSIRGQLVMINMCCIAGGLFCASAIAYGFSFVRDGEEWRYMLGFAAVPAIIQFFGFLFMPESPRWLISNGRYSEGKQELARIRPYGSDTDREFEVIKANCVRNKEEQELLADPNQSTLRRIMATQPVRKALLVGCLLQVVQQLSGINTVMYYTATIFEMSGVHSKQVALLLSTGTALVNFIFTVVGYSLVERIGRRRLILFSLFGVVIGLLTLALGFQMAYYNSPKVTQTVLTPANQLCSELADCAACARKPECGFCFETNENSRIRSLSATCLLVNTTVHSQSALGNCTMGSSNSSIWAYEWCPSAYSWITALGMAMYLFFFAPGMGPMPWTINSEIYPAWARSSCLSASTSVCWLSNLLVSMTFLSLTRAITTQGAFYLYASMASLGFVYFLIVLPETRSKTLEELEYLFADKKWSRRRDNSTEENEQES